MKNEMSLCWDVGGWNQGSDAEKAVTGFVVTHKMLVHEQSTHENNGDKLQVDDVTLSFSH